MCGTAIGDVSPGMRSVSPDTSSICATERRSPSRKMGLIAFGLLMWSVAMREVSEVPAGWVFSISQNIPPCLTLWAKTAPSRMYWLPMAEFRFSSLGFSGSAGGLQGLNAMWQAPQATPTRYGFTRAGSAA